eukprot:6654140-Pyramimonas_sp.AAC.1
MDSWGSWGTPRPYNHSTPQIIVYYVYKYAFRVWVGVSSGGGARAEAEWRREAARGHRSVPAQEPAGGPAGRGHLRPRLPHRARGAGRPQVQTLLGLQLL